MTQLTRILINSDRLDDSNNFDRRLKLSEKENHYLRRVLRLKMQDNIEVVDGKGNLWKASLVDKEFIQFKSAYDSPEVSKPNHNILLGLAIVIPRMGFNDVLRMTTEMGIDVLQPLISERSAPSIFERTTRWDTIITEAVEQSERLWKPKILKTVELNKWLIDRPEKSAYSLATPRISEAKEFMDWMELSGGNFEQIWVAIGPEGGWTKNEEDLAEKNGCQRVKFGTSILRTSTAAVGATQLMVTYRRNSSE